MAPPVQLPPELREAHKTQLRAVKTLEMGVRKLRKKLRAEESSSSVTPPVPHKVREKCGDCNPCKMVPCGECQTCQARGTAASTRAQVTDPEADACVQEDRRCVNWRIPSTSAAPSVSSKGSVATPTSLQAGIVALNRGLTELGNATADLNHAIHAAGGGPWEGWPMLTVVAVDQLCEEHEEGVEEVCGEAERKKMELEGLADFEGEDDGEENARHGSQEPSENSRNRPPLQQPSSGEASQVENRRYGSAYASGLHQRNGDRPAFAQDLGEALEAVQAHGRWTQETRSRGPGPGAPPTSRSSVVPQPTRARAPSGLSSQGETGGRQRTQDQTRMPPPRQVRGGGTPNWRFYGGSQPGGNPNQGRESQAWEIGRAQMLMRDLERKSQDFKEELKVQIEEVGMYEQQGISESHLVLMETDRNHLKALLEEVRALADKCRAGAEDEAEAAMQAREEQDFHRWGIDQIRLLRSRARGALLEPNERGCGTPAAAAHPGHLERVNVPEFSGAEEDYPGFRRSFLGLTAPAKYPEEVWLTILRKKVPLAARRLLEGHTKMSEAWKVLDRRYGSRDVAVASARAKLLGLRTKGPLYEQVEQLWQAVLTAQTSLQAVEAGDLLFCEFGVVGTLVDKLPQSCQERWDLTSGNLMDKSTPQERGEKFLRWLEKEGAGAASARLRGLQCSLRDQDKPSGGGSQEPPKCSRCQKSGHKVNECVSPIPGGVANVAEGRGDEEKGGGKRKEKEPDRSEWRTKMKTEEGAKEIRETVRQRSSMKCPVCQQQHTYARHMEWGDMEWPSDRLDSCTKFKSLTVQERGKAVEEHRGCEVCLAWRHQRATCNLASSRSPPKCTERVGGGACGKLHHALLHGSGNAYCQAATTMGTQHQPRDPRPDLFTGQTAGEMIRAGTLNSIFEFVHAPVVSREGERVEAIMFADPGSNLNFIRHDLAKQLKLVGVPTPIYLRVVDTEYREKEVLVFQLGVEDRRGVLHQMEAVGVETIAEALPIADQEAVREAFPEAPEAALQRPVGQAGVLLSMSERQLHSGDGKEVGRLRLSQTLLGCGLVITGMTTSLKANTSTSGLSAECRSLQGALAVRPARASAFFVSSLGGMEDRAAQLEEEKDWESRPPPICAACRGCSECKFRREKCTREEQEVVERVEREMVLKGSTLHGSYPFRSCVERMKCNRDQIIKVQQKVEARAVSDGTYEMLQAEFMKAVNNKTVSKIEKEEIETYSGPVNYNPYFGVINEGSVSTRLRIVLHSAFKNCRSGLSLNDCMYKGPSALAALTDVLLHFRTVLQALIFDIEKAYNAVVTGERERHLRRVVWRESPDMEWEDYGYDRATFGDVAAGLLLATGMKMAATIGEEIDPEAARQIREKVYVDDGLAGGSAEMVDRMKGSEGKEGTISQILATCGLRLKYMVRTGDPQPEAAAALGGKVLGVTYSLAEDKISYSLPMKFHLKKKKGNKVVVEISRAVLEDLKRGRRQLSRREALSFVAGVYDPLGHIGPVLLKGRLMLQRLHGVEGLDWDGGMPDEERTAWVEWLEDLTVETQVTMERTVRPPGARGKPTLACFSDASEVAMCCTIYVVWQTEKTPTSRLLLAKVRVVPKGTSTPRAEMQAAVVMGRMMMTALRAAAFTCSRVTQSTDSACCVAAVRRTGAALFPYFANRIAEALHTLKEARKLSDEVENLTHVPGPLNPADIGTRPGVRLSELGLHSLWQEGPEFLKLGRKEWPLTEAVEGNIPREEVRTQAASFLLEATTKKSGSEKRDGRTTTWMLEMAEESLVEATSWSTAQGALARRIRATFSQRREDILVEPTPRERDMAARLQLLVTAPSAIKAMEDGKLLSLGAERRKGLVVVSGRVRREHLARLLGVEVLPVVMATERLAYLIMVEAHGEDHRRSPQDVLGRSRKKAWIPRGGALARKVIRSCIFCRHSNLKTQSQIMASLPEEKLTRAAPFQFSALDMFGPIQVKDVAKGRRRYKCWGCLYTCLATHAVALYATPGYSTDTFLSSHLKFTSTYGEPEKCYSDHGPQLTAGAARLELDWNQVKQEGGTRTEWIFTPKGCSWRNGQAEVCIRSARRSLQHLLPKYDTLDFHEFDGVLHRVAFIINSRPLAVRSSGEQEFYSITANDLLLGRASRPRGLQTEPGGGLDLGEEDDETAGATLTAQEEVARAWWAMWTSKCFPEMVPRKRWKTAHRDVQVGDVAHIKYSSRFAAPTFRLCRVTEVYPDHEGRVRTCDVAMRPRRAGESGSRSYVFKTPNIIPVGVQRLAVLLPKEEQERLNEVEMVTEELRESQSDRKPKDDGEVQQRLTAGTGGSRTVKTTLGQKEGSLEEDQAAQVPSLGGMRRRGRPRAAHRKKMYTK